MSCLLLGCSSPTFVPLPQGIALDQGGVFLERSGSSVKVSAVASLDAARIVEGATTVDLLLYGDLDAVELVSGGPFPREDCRYASPDKVFGLDLSALAPSWTIATLLRPELVPPLVRDPYPRCKSPCPRVRVRTFAIGVDGFVISGAELGPGTALADVAGKLFVVDRAKSSRITGCDEFYPSMVGFGGGRVAASTVRGDLAILQIDTDAMSCAVESSTVTTPFEELAWLGGTELLGASKLGRIERWDGMRRVGARTLEVPAERPRLSMAARADELMISFGVTVFHGSFDDLVEEQVPLSPSDTGFGSPNLISTVAFVDGVGRLAGSTRGEILVASADGEWSAIDGIATDKIGAFEPYDDGFLATIEGGRVIFYQASAGFCEDTVEVLGAKNRAGKFVLRDGDDAMILGFVEDSVLPAEAVWLERE